MKKRIMATLLVGVLTAGSVVGFSACDRVSVPKGDEVTAEEWKTAFEKTEDVTNYTMDVSINVESSVEGSVWKYKSSTDTPIIIVTRGSADLSTRTTILYNADGDEEASRPYENRSYMETSSSYNSSEKESGVEEISNSKSTSKTYYSYRRNKNDKDYFWKVTCSSSEENDLDSRSSKEKDWYADEYSSFARNYITDMFSETMFYETNDKENAEAKSIIDMYDKFNYADGKYSAVLYRKVTIYNGIINVGELIECTVWVSFNKAESCVIGCGIKCEGSGTAVKEDKYNLEYSYKGESVYSISNLNNTNVAEKENKDIRKAIDKAVMKEQLNS